jgi:hypothetical protein
MKRQFLLSTCTAIAVTGFVFAVATYAYGQNATAAEAQRHIKGRTIYSREFPKAKLSVRKGLQFIGTQQITLSGNAAAEQYVFAKPGAHNAVERFYLIQFEHFLPSNNLTYTYDSTRTTQLGDLSFTYDVKSLPDLAAVLAADPGSDGDAMEHLLAQHHLSLSHQTALVRMFHLPSADHRTELMIIYGEALPQNSAVPLRNDAAQLDTASAQMFLGHARQGLVVQTR